MGMFDDIRYEYAAPLPDGYEGRDFQTKEFGCNLARYKISAEGRILQPLDDQGDVAGVFAGPVVRWRDVHFHGWLHFYTYITRHDMHDGEWHGYYAKFTDGQLVKIECDEQSTKDMTARARGE